MVDGEIRAQRESIAPLAACLANDRRQIPIDCVLGEQGRRCAYTLRRQSGETIFNLSSYGSAISVDIQQQRKSKNRRALCLGSAKQGIGLHIRLVVLFLF